MMDVERAPECQGSGRLRRVGRGQDLPVGSKPNGALFRPH